MHPTRKATSNVTFDDFYGDLANYTSMKNYLCSPNKPSVSNESNQELVFDSQFECGNLLKVFKHRYKEYVLIL